MEKLDVTTSLLGFGCMRFPIMENGEVDKEETRCMMEEAIAHGVNYFDTAWPYHDGKSEGITGEILKEKKRDSFYLATKLPTWEIHNRADAERIFEKQLRRLQVDYIDFYLLHAIAKESFDKLVNVGALDYCLDMQKKGRIKYLGFSFHGEGEEFEYILNYRNWDFCQIQLNYMDMEEQAGRKGYLLAEEKGVPVIAMEPVRGGSLANLPDEIGDIFRSLNPQASCASWALRYVGSLKNVKVILSGMSSMMQVKDNIATFEKFRPLESQEEKVFENVAEALRKRVQNRCTFCKYCVPCPAGVNIPQNFSAWNQYHMYQDTGKLEWAWKQGMSDGEKAKNCTECGLCEEACPQKISIREDLKKVWKDIEETLGV